MNKLEALKKKINEEAMDSDVVAAIFYCSNIAKHSNDRCLLQRYFYEIKQIDPELLKNFSFDVSGICPFSEELDAVLFRYETATILPDNVDALKISYEKYSHDEQARIRNVSKLIATFKSI